MSGTIPCVMPRKKYGETSFGERLQAIRKARGLTQVQLAEAAGTTQRAISYYETEAGFPPAPAVIAWTHRIRGWSRSTSNSPIMRERIFWV